MSAAAWIAGYEDRGHGRTRAEAWASVRVGRDRVVLLPATVRLAAVVTSPSRPVALRYVVRDGRADVQ